MDLYRSKFDGSLPGFPGSPLSPGLPDEPTPGSPGGPENIKHVRDWHFKSRVKCVGDYLLDLLDP